MVTRTKSSDLIGDLLVREGLITEEQLRAALQEQRANGYRLGYTLVSMGVVSETDLTRVLARKYRVKAVDLSRIDQIDKRVIALEPGSHRRASLFHRIRHRAGGGRRVLAAQSGREVLRDR
jgi:hypothetical protein